MRMMKEDEEVRYGRFGQLGYDYRWVIEPNLERTGSYQLYTDTEATGNPNGLNTPKIAA